MSTTASPTVVASGDDHELIFYDLKCATAGACWSPHCWKTRLALQYKGVKFRTVWVSYPDIKSVVGHTQPNEDMPTLPVIQHGTTWVADSWAIVQYLEEHFPSPPLLVPSIESVHFFMYYCEGVVIPSVRKFIVPRVAGFLDEKGREYFVRTREKSFGMSLEEVGKGQDVQAIRQPLGPVSRSLNAYGPYLGGKQISYMDLILLGMLQWLDRSEHEAVVIILEMFQSGTAYPLKAWYDRVKHLAVAQPEPVEEKP